MHILVFNEGFDDAKFQSSDVTVISELPLQAL